MTPLPGHHRLITNLPHRPAAAVHRPRTPQAVHEPPVHPPRQSAPAAPPATGPRRAHSRPKHANQPPTPQPTAGCNACVFRYSAKTGEPRHPAAQPPVMRQALRRRHAAVPERSHRHAQPACAQGSPSCNRISCSIDQQHHALTRQHAKQVPEQMQRRRQNTSRLAAHQVRQSPGQGLRRHRLLQLRRLPKRQRRPRRQNASRMAHPGIERTGKVHPARVHCRLMLCSAAHSAAGAAAPTAALLRWRCSAPRPTDPHPSPRDTHGYSPAPADARSAPS